MLFRLGITMKLKLSPLLATIFFALFAPAASAQQVNCDGWIADSWQTAEAFWESIDVEVVSTCIAAGADVNARDEAGTSPLHWAAKYNDNRAVITALIAAGADVNARREGADTPLHAAALANDNPAVITALIEAGANGAATNDDRETPFDLAKKNDAIKGSDAYWALNDARFK